MKALKSAIVAGVGPGIGASLSKQLAKEGYHVAMIARNAEYLGQLEKEILVRFGL
jgi:short-subunit dehydrogenase